MKYADVKPLYHTPMPIEEIDLNLWREFCEWLDARPYKCAVQSQIPEKFHFTYSGGGVRGVQNHRERIATGLIIYRSGWGWRLRKGWNEILTNLENLKRLEK